MSEDVAIVVGIKGDTTGGRVIKKSLDDIASSGDKATTSTKRLELQAKATALAGDAMARAFGAAAAIFGASQIVKMADNYRLLEARVNSVTGSVKETTRVMGELRKISDQTGSSMEASVGILQRLSFSRNEIKATNNEMLVFTETVTKLGIMSGASSEALKNGLTQLGQALSSSIVRAEEFNSIMENTPGIGKAIADQFGVTTGQLRLLIINGKVLRDDVFAAILNQSAKVREEFEAFPRTAEQGFNQMLGRITQIVDEVNKASGGTNALGLAFRTVGDLVKRVYDGIVTTFDFAVAGIGELINYMLRGINLAIDGMNKLKSVVPGADKTPIDKFNTVDSGSLIKAAADNTVERNNRLFASNTKDIEVSTRNISQNYSEMADKLSTNTKLTKEQREAIKVQKKIQDDLKDAVKDSRSETEKLYDKIAEQERLKPYAKTAEQAEAIAKNIKKAQDELEELRVKAELNSPVGKAFQSLAKEIDGDFKDAFKDAFTSSDGGFKKLLEGWKNAFKSFLADLAYQAMVRPILVSLVGSVGGALGLSGGSISSVLGGSSRSAGGSSGSLLSNGTSLLSAGKSLFSGGSLLFNQGASSFFGQAGSGLGGLLGMDQYSALEFGDKIGNFAGSAGSFANIGGSLVGGGLASILGLGNQNALINAGASTIGGLIGQAAIPVPFVGAAIGSFVGSALGGLFGGSKPSDMAQRSYLNFDTLEVGNGGQTGKKYSASNAAFVQGITTEASNLVQLIKSVGGSVTGGFSAVAGNRDGLRLSNYNGTETNYGFDSAAFVKAAMQIVVDGTTGLGDTFQKILDKLGVGDTQKLAAGFEFGKQYDAFVTPVKTSVDVLKDALDALNKQLVDLQQQATDLGLPTDKLTEAYNKQKDALLGSIKAQMAGFQSLENMNNTFKSFFDGQALGSNSSLSPTEKLQLAQDNFGGLLSKAQGGDLSVTQELLKSANDLLDIGRNVYASSVPFAGLEGFVRSSVSGVAKQAGYEGADNTQSLTSEIIKGNTQLNGSVAEMVELIRDLYDEAVRTRKLQESIRNQNAATA